MQIISETVRETFIKLSGFFGVISVILFAKYGGIWPPNFGGRGGKVENFTPYISKMGVPGDSHFFVQLGAFEYSKIKS